MGRYLNMYVCIARLCISPWRLREEPSAWTCAADGETKLLTQQQQQISFVLSPSTPQHISQYTHQQLEPIRIWSEPIRKVLSAEKRACTFRAPWWSLYPRLWTRRCKIEIQTLLTKPRDSVSPGFILYPLISTQMIENSPFTHHPSDRSVRTNIRVFFFSWISGKALRRPDHSASCSAGVWQSEPQDYVTAWTSRSTRTHGGAHRHFEEAVLKWKKQGTLCGAVKRRLWHLLQTSYITL